MRILTPADLPGCMRLKEAAGWNQTEQDWRNVMRLSPEGCFGIDCDGRLAATTTAVCYGTQLAWIGMVLTAPEYRGRGFARRLMEHAIAWIEARGVDWIKLDATDMGRPLYAKLGFEEEGQILRYAQDLRGRGSGVLLASLAGSGDGSALARAASLDNHAFGAERRELLKMLAEYENAAVLGGYAFGRPGSKAAYFGPCVAETVGAARELLAWFCARHAGETIYWDILPSNSEAVALAQEFGFAPLRHLVRMVRPGRAGASPLAHNDAQIFAIAGFEYG